MEVLDDPVVDASMQDEAVGTLGLKPRQRGRLVDEVDIAGRKSDCPLRVFLDEGISIEADRVVQYASAMLIAEGRQIGAAAGDAESERRSRAYPLHFCPLRG